MTTVEIILTVFLAIACVIGGVLLYRLEHVTALNIDLRRENEKLRSQLGNISAFVEQEYKRYKNEKK